MAPERSAVMTDRIGDLAPLVTSSLGHLRAENKAQQTIMAYAAEGRARFLAANGMPTQAAAIRREHVEAFLEDQLARRAPATARNRYRGFQQFFSWLVDEGEIPHSPMDRMKPPILPEKPGPVVKPEDLKRLLDTCDGWTLEGRRDEAIIPVLIDSGARLSELADLRIDSEDGGDVDLDGGVLRVFGRVAGNAWSRSDRRERRRSTAT